MSAAFRILIINALSLVRGLRSRVARGVEESIRFRAALASNRTHLRAKDKIKEVS